MQSAKMQSAKKQDVQKHSAKNQSVKNQGVQKGETPRQKRKRISNNKEDCLFAVGAPVCDLWPNDDGDGGEWYTGKVVSINYDARTVHILYDDNDVDDAVPWEQARILDG